MSLNAEFFEFEKEDQNEETLINGELLISHSKPIVETELNEDNKSFHGFHGSHGSHGSGHTSHVSHGHTSAAG